MDKQAKRIAIAEACGWKQLQDYPVILRDTEEVAWADYCWSHPVHGVEHGEHEPPNYLSCLNAMHEAEKALTPEQWGIYEDILSREVEFVWHATAAQRGEAFLETIGK